MNVILFPQSVFCQATCTATITDGTQLSHIKTILSAQVGDCLRVGVLHGKLGVGIIRSLTDHECQLSDVVLDKDPPPKLPLTLILALPRPKVLRRLIMDMAAMGVGHIVLINSTRTDKSYWGSPLLARLDEFVVEGLQQGVDTVPPVITLAKRFKPFVQDELPLLIKDKLACVFHPYAKHTFGELTKQGLPQVVVIGAEGGFVPYEIELLASVGVSDVTLGRRILRTESAVNAVLGRWLD